LNIEEFEPLFPAGLHNISLNELERYFVEPFSETTTRSYLVQRFRAFFEKLQQLEISFEMWIDGSFLTLKSVPNDVDLVTFFNPSDINSLSVEKQALLKEIFEERHETKIRYHCDVYVAYANDSERINYWGNLFGFSRNKTPKGIARLIWHN